MEEEPGSADSEYREYVIARWPALVRTAYLLTGDEHLAEDLAQIALTKVYTAWRRIRRVDNIDAYVRRVMVNANTGRFRQRRVAEHLSAAPPDAATYEPHAPLAQRSVLMAELARLPSRQRAIVVLRFWMTFGEAGRFDARMLGGHREESDVEGFGAVACQPGAQRDRAVRPV